MDATDSIHISNLQLETHIGVTDEEQAEPQRLTVSLTLHLRTLFSGLGDDIDRTIDYADVCNVVRRNAASRPRRLIETLAEDIATHVLDGFSLCRQVEVELRKFILPETDYVAVRLSRRRADLP